MKPLSGSKEIEAVVCTQHAGDVCPQVTGQRESKTDSDLVHLTVGCLGYHPPAFQKARPPVASGQPISVGDLEGFEMHKRRTVHPVIQTKLECLVIRGSSHLLRPGNRVEVEALRRDFFH